MSQVTHKRGRRGPSAAVAVAALAFMASHFFSRRNVDKCKFKEGEKFGKTKAGLAEHTNTMGLVRKHLCAPLCQRETEKFLAWAHVEKAGRLSPPSHGQARFLGNFPGLEH